MTAANRTPASPAGWLEVAFLPEMTDAAYRRLRETLADPSDLFSGRTAAVARVSGIARERIAGFAAAESRAAARRDVEAVRAAGGRAIAGGDAEYPALLREIFSPPRFLALRGSLDDPEERRVAIVGSRDTDRRSRETAFALASTLARRGYCVVSGLARGVDTAAHEGALDGGGPTIAVLGAGLDAIYPRENESLAQRIAERGALVTPFAPATPTLPQNFPHRNQTIAGLCRAVVVVQAPRRSGALITARMALHSDREVFAMPGPAGDPRYEGSNLLLRDGAHVCLDLGDLVAELEGHEAALAFWREGEARAAAGRESGTDSLSDDERAVLGAVASDPLHVDEIARASGLPPASLLPLLLNLEIKGAISAYPGALYARRPSLA